MHLKYVLGNGKTSRSVPLMRTLIGLQWLRYNRWKIECLEKAGVLTDDVISRQKEELIVCLFEAVSGLVTPTSLLGFPHVVSSVLYTLGEYLL